VGRPTEGRKSLLGDRPKGGSPFWGDRPKGGSPCGETDRREEVPFGETDRREEVPVGRPTEGRKSLLGKPLGGNNVSLSRDSPERECPCFRWFNYRSGAAHSAFPGIFFSKLPPTFSSTGHGKVMSELPGRRRTVFRLRTCTHLLIIRMAGGYHRRPASGEKNHQCPPVRPGVHIRRPKASTEPHPG
jgi:hypothetical protein